MAWPIEIPAMTVGLAVRMTRPDYHAQAVRPFKT
jgi:hypothetical protein